MILKLPQKWTFTAEGDDSAFMHLLHGIDEEVYRDWVNERSLLYDDDPDAGIIGTLNVRHTGDLLNLLKAAIESGIEHNVTCHVGDHRNGSAGWLFCPQAPPDDILDANWNADIETISLSIGTAMKEIRRIAGESVYGTLGGGEDESR